jgi:hypothetical protein
MPRLPDYDRPQFVKTFRFICDFKRAHDGNSPSLREICDGTGMVSTSTANYHLMRLAEEGKITISDNKSARLICVIGGKWEYISLENWATGTG